MTPEQEAKIRELYADSLEAGNGEETMPRWAAEKLAAEEPLDIILELLGGHSDLDDILDEEP